ncbi:MAG: prolyl oligopeptidase family serine peptidase [Bacteroidota bacterium]
MEAVFERLIPDYETNKETALQSRSAIRWVDQFPKKVPILMLHGQSDWRVKVQQAENLAAEMKKNKIPYQLIIYKDGSHGLKEYQQEVNKEVLKWLSTYL